MTPPAIIKLQWSHDLSAMDTILSGCPPRPDSARFNGAMTFQPWIRPELLAQKRLELRLQWSHDLSAMDTSHVDYIVLHGYSLQWSHDLSAMDTRPIQP